MGVVGLPRREEHGQNRDKRGERAGSGGAISNGCGFQKAGEGAVQRVDSVAIISSTF